MSRPTDEPLAVDRPPGPRVSPNVRRFFAMLLALGLAACTAKKKESSTTPAQPGEGGDGSGVPEVGERGGTDQPEVPDDLDQEWSGSDSGDADRGEAGDGEGDATGDDEEEAEVIKPPDLDLSPDERARKVREHLTQAKRALSGSSRSPEKAIKEAKAALDADGTNVDAVALLALAYFHMGWDETAEQTLRTVYDSSDNGVQRRARDNANVYYVFGLLYDRAGDDLRALVAYETAVDKDPNHRSALVNLGRRYVQNDLGNKAVPIFEKLIKQLDAESALTWNNLGAAYRGVAADSNDRGRANQYLQRAEQAFKRAVQADRDYAPAYYNLGVLYMDADDMPGDALKRLKRAVTYLDEYKTKPGADQEKANARLKVLNRAIKRETRARKRNQ